MPAVQGLLLHPRFLLIGGVATFLFLLLLLGHSTETGTQAVGWIKGISADHDNSSPLRKRISDVYNTTLGFEKALVVSLPERFDHRDSLVLTSALTNFRLEFIDGVKPEAILEKTLPHHAGIPNNGARGAWRGHINAIREVVDKGYGSAIIFEEDADWDIRLKDQLRDFAIASNGLLAQFPRTHVPHFANQKGDFIDYTELAKWLKSQESSIPVPDSPYGDGWDVLWLGNCGTRLEARGPEWQTLPIVRSDDPTVVPVTNYSTWDSKDEPQPYSNYSNHTRLYLSQPSDGVCSIAYAVSQHGARRILFELGMERADKAFDLMLQDYCQGGWEGGLPHACWGVTPPFFAQHRAAGAENRDSDIATEGEEVKVREQGFTKNIQRSVRMNVRKLIADPPEEVLDQFPYAEGT